MRAQQATRALRYIEIKQQEGKKRARCKQGGCKLAGEREQQPVLAVWLNVTSQAQRD